VKSSGETLRINKILFITKQQVFSYLLLFNILMMMAPYLCVFFYKVKSCKCVVLYLYRYLARRKKGGQDVLASVAAGGGELKQKLFKGGQDALASEAADVVELKQKLLKVVSNEMNGG